MMYVGTYICMYLCLYCIFAYAPTEAHFTNIGDAATFAAPAIVLIEDRGGAVVRIDHCVGANTVSRIRVCGHMCGMWRGAIDASGARLC